MLTVIMPVGNSFGWGVCGKYLTRDLSNLTNVELLTYSLSNAIVSDPYDYNFLSSKYLGDDVVNSYSFDTPYKSKHILQCVSEDLSEWKVASNADFKVGYTFFDNTMIDEKNIENIKNQYDILVAGSKWCEEALNSNGLTKTKTIIQGIDSQIFNSANNEKQYLKDKFVIFSGGKFELRKGQDLVIKAFKVLQDKYDDVMLVTSWSNYWASSVNSMTGSPHINFSIDINNFNNSIDKLLTDNGIKLENVFNLKHCSNSDMARIYKNTDIGLFPNRCEAGTNLVLMEYMATGKPVIASYNTGHKDILTEHNSLMLKHMQKTAIHHQSKQIATWDSPVLDEIIANLEWAYHNRDSLDKFAKNAADDLSKMTWQSCAQQFYDLYPNS